MRKEDMLSYLKQKTEELTEEMTLTPFTAAAMSQLFSVQRNTISHYLNQSLAKGEVIKVNSRPVYFFHRATFEGRFHPVSDTVFDSMKQLFAEEANPVEPLPSEEAPQPEAGDPDRVFCNFIGAEGSLKHAIVQSFLHHRTRLSKGDGVKCLSINLRDFRADDFVGKLTLAAADNIVKGEGHDEKNKNRQKDKHGGIG